MVGEDMRSRAHQNFHNAVKLQIKMKEKIQIIEQQAENIN